MGLSKDPMETLDQASRGAFLYLFVSEARTILDRNIGKTPCTSIHDELPEEEKESSPKQENEVLIAKPQPLQSQDLALNSEPSLPQNPPTKEEIQPFEFSFGIKDDLFDADCGGFNPYTLMAKLGPARIGGSVPPKDDVRPG